MKKNNKGNTLIIMIFIGLGVISLGAYQLYQTSILGTNNNKNRLSISSQINLFGNEYEKTKGDVIDIPADMGVSMNVPKLNSGSTLRIEYGSGESILRIKSVSQINSSIANKNQKFTIHDTSSWDTSTRLLKLKEQQELLDNGDSLSLDNFRKDEMNKIGKAGSYVVLDLQKVTLMNAMNIDFLKNKEILPEIIKVTFDNGVKYVYSLDKLNDKKKILFNDVNTQFVRIDIIKTSNGVIDNSNGNVSNGISGTLTSVDIQTSTNGAINEVLIDFSNISGAKYYNIYLEYSGIISRNVSLSKPIGENSFIITRKTGSRITGYNLEYCSGFQKCNLINIKF